MGGAHGVDTHVLKQFELMTQSRPVYCRAERSEIMVVAYALEFGRLSIEEKSFFGDKLKAAYSEACIVGVGLFSLDIYIGTCRV